MTRHADHRDRPCLSSKRGQAPSRLATERRSTASRRPAAKHASRSGRQQRQQQHPGRSAGSSAGRSSWSSSSRRLLLLRPGDGGGAGAGASASPGASAGGRRNGDVPDQPAAGAARPGETRTVTLTTPKGAMVLKIEADLSPIAAGNFVALAVVRLLRRDRLPSDVDPPGRHPFVIQGGDPTGTGTGGPGYTIKDEPVTTPYKRGTVAMARSSRTEQRRLAVLHRPRRQGRAALGDPKYNNYQIIGNVTSGMETADAIFAAAGGVELPAESHPDHDSDRRQPLSPAPERRPHP